MLETEPDVSQARRKIVSFIKEKVELSQTDGVVFELEGSINSAVTAYLSVEALGTRRVTGLLMPDLRVADERDIADAKAAGEELCLDVKQFDIAPIHRAFMKNLGENRSAEDNLRERIRMSLLYYHANTANRLVMGTVSRASLLLGNFTKYGDGGVDILPIADLREREVRKLGEVLGIRRRIIAKKEPRSIRGWTSIIEAGVDSDTADRIFGAAGFGDSGISGLVTRSGVSTTKVAVVVSRYEATSHKRRASEICSVR